MLNLHLLVSISPRIKMMITYEGLYGTDVYSERYGISRVRGFAEFVLYSEESSVTRVECGSVTLR